MPWHAEQDVTHSSGRISPKQNAQGNSTILIALVMAFAVAGGAILTTLGTIGFDGLVDNAGLSRTTLSARQYEQANSIATLDRTLTNVGTELASLKAKVEKFSGTEAGDRLAKFGGELEIVKRGMRHLAGDIGNIDRRVEAINAGVPGGDPAAIEKIAKLDADVSALKKTVADVATDVEFVGQRVETVATRAATSFAMLRSSIDASDERLVAATRRLDKIDNGDLTASIPAPRPAAAPPRKRHMVASISGWSVREAYDGKAVLTSTIGAFEVEPGTIVPGLGRVDTIRQQRGRWVVTTAKGAMVQQQAPVTPTTQSLTQP